MTGKDKEGFDLIEAEELCIATSRPDQKLTVEKYDIQVLPAYQLLMENTPGALNLQKLDYA